MAELARKPELVSSDVDQASIESFKLSILKEETITSGKVHDFVKGLKDNEVTNEFWTQFPVSVFFFFYVESFNAIFCGRFKV